MGLLWKARIVERGLMEPTKAVYGEAMTGANSMISN